MSFRKRNVGISAAGAARGPPGASSQPQQQPQQPPPEAQAQAQSTPGVRPSPIDGRPTTSTGTASLDGLLAGHAGLALGNSLLIEENGTTDYAATLLRYYAAEGVVQGHTVHVVGVGEHWGRSLPGLVGTKESSEDKAKRRKDEKMKIAWRYERLGEFGAGVAGSRDSPAPQRSPASAETGADSSVFCHSFDLTKRLNHPALSSLNYIPIAASRPDSSPYTTVLKRLSSAISSSSPNTIHRIMIPSLLSPALYPPHASQPEHILQFLHTIRGLLSTYPNRVSIMISLPLALYPRSSGLVRWMELLSDGVFELAPFPHSADGGPTNTTSGAATSQEEPPQGMLKVHRLPVFHERGGGGDINIGEDWAFTLSRRTFAIKPYSLPPVEDDNEAQKGDSAKTKQADLEF